MVADNVSKFVQNVYQIRADSVRIYNTCDTAELILENHTQDTLGLLIENSLDTWNLNLTIKKPRWYRFYRATG